VKPEKVEPEKVLTIREHSKTFLDLYKPEQKPSAKRDKKASLRILLPHFGNITPERLTQRDVDAWVAGELKRGSARKTINNRLAVLSTLLKYAVGERSKLRFHVSGMMAEVHAVEPADIERLLAACNDDRHRAVILLAYEAGLRVGEIRGLQWTDWRDGQLTIRRALDKQTGEVLTPKHDKLRKVPVSPRVKEVLDALPRRGLWVVSRDGGGTLGYWPLMDAVHAIYDRAGVTRPPWPMHALRHSHGTVMAKKVPLPVLQRLMGHSEIQTTMRYVDVSESDKREAIAAVFGECRNASTDPEGARCAPTVQRTSEHTPAEDRKLLKL
jgi:integrase